MTAPDSRDSVAMRLLNDLHLIASQGETPDGDGATVNVQLWAEKWADRLQALARGPQRAGGEDWLDAFVQGAKWWEWHKTGATMWQSDQALAYERAQEKYAVRLVRDGDSGEGES